MPAIHVRRAMLQRNRPITRVDQLRARGLVGKADISLERTCLRRYDHSEQTEKDDSRSSHHRSPALQGVSSRGCELSNGRIISIEPTSGVPRKNRDDRGQHQTRDRIVQERPPAPGRGQQQGKIQLMKRNGECRKRHQLSQHKQCRIGPACPIRAAKRCKPSQHQFRDPAPSHVDDGVHDVGLSRGVAELRRQSRHHGQVVSAWKHEEPDPRRSQERYGPGAEPPEDSNMRRHPRQSLEKPATSIPHTTFSRYCWPMLGGRYRCPYSTSLYSRSSS